MFSISTTQVSIALLLLLRVILNAEATLQPLTDAEADTIILAKEQYKEASKAVRVAELEQVTIKSEGRGGLANGQKVIIREVEPPANPIKVGASFAEIVLPQAITPTSEQIANFEAYAQKEYQVIMLSATVHDHAITRLKWKLDSVDYLAFVNLDFNYLRGTSSLHNETTDYTVLMGIGNASTANSNREPLPTLPAFRTEQSEYVLLKGDLNNQAALAGIEALLTHFDLNEATLRTQYQRREALTAVQERYRAKHPKQQDGCILQFWVPESTDRKATSE